MADSPASTPLTGTPGGGSEVPAPAVPATGSLPPIRSGRPRRRWLVPAIVAVVAAVAIVAVLAASGVFTPKAKTHVPTYPTFFEAKAAASPAAGAIPGGPWTAIAAAGFRTGVGFSINTSSLANQTLANCSFRFLTSTAGVISLNATPPATRAGAAAFWLVVFLNGSGQLAAVQVSGGSASAVFDTTGPGCSSHNGTALTGFPSNALDSPDIVQAANASGGTAFLTANPAASQFYFGAGGVTYSIFLTEPVWFVEDTTCPLVSTSSTNGSVFSATVLGAGVATVQNRSTTAVSCPSTPTTSLLLFFESALGVAASKAI